MRKILVLGWACICAFSASAQTSGCNDSPLGELTVNSSCSPVNFNGNFNTDYWDASVVFGLCGESDHDDAWMWFTAVSETVTIFFSPVSGDPVLTVFAGDCDPSSNLNIGCSNNPGNSDEMVTVTTIPGKRYRIRLQNFNSDDDLTGRICVFTNMILPLKLLSFTGLKTDMGNSLKWKTANEVNTLRFDIERSTNGGGFEKIGEQAAGGSTDYGFIDLDVVAGEKYFYRLKIIDRDGQFTYSGVLALNKATAGNTSYSVYPNPVNGGHFYIKPVQEYRNEVTASIMEAATGKKVLSSVLNHNDLQNGRFEIQTHQLKPGIYIVKFSDKNSQFIQATRIVVTR